MLSISVLILVIFALRDITCVKSVKRCKTDSECDTSYQFCDAVVSACNHCGVLPCSRPLIKEQGDDLCKKICPEYWASHITKWKKEDEARDLIPHDMTIVPETKAIEVPVINSNSDYEVQEASAVSSTTGLYILVGVCAVLTIVGIILVLLWVCKDQLKTCCIYMRVQQPPAARAKSDRVYYKGNIEEGHNLYTVKTSGT